MSDTLKKGAQLTLQIKDLNNLGFGVAHAPDGRAVFVAGCVTGDIASVQIIKVNKTFAVARLLEILTPSPDREDGFCNAAAGCGGCVYRYLTYERELALKQSYVAHAFRKAGLADVTVEPVRTTGQTKHYRNKAEYPIANGKNGLYGGFFASKTHRVVAGDACSLQPSVFGEILRATCEFFSARGVTAYDEETGKGVLRHLYLRQGVGSGELIVTPVINADTLPYADEYVAMLRERFPTVSSVLFNVNKKSTNVVLGKEFHTLYGKPYLTDVLCNRRFCIAPDSFYQVNHDATELLYGIAAERTGLDGKGLLLDLYCGAGTIGLSMAHLANELVGIEIVPAAVACAKENAAENGVQNAAFYCGDAADAEQLLAEAERARGTLHPDVVILDPPRKGCDKALLDFLAARNVPRIVYVSCGPDSLARDCAILRALGYEIGNVTPVDLFPRTGHVENVVCLTKHH